MYTGIEIRGLFVMHEGISSTIFQSQVLEHSISLRKDNIILDILSFEVFLKMWCTSISNKKSIKKTNPEIKIDLKRGFNIYYPFSTILNAIYLLITLHKMDVHYDFIHARSDYTTFLCLLLKPIHGLPVLWDCRGDSIDELTEAINRKPTLLKLTIGTFLKARQRLMISIIRKFSNGSIFVSDELYKIHSTERSKNNVIIPCPVPEDKFFFDEKIRKELRGFYNFDDDKQVFLYSGSMVHYQGLEEQKKLYENLLSSNINNIIIFATKDKDNAAKYFSGFPSSRFFIMSFKYHEMNSIYNLADFAIMLREPRALNWVASPTKFGEYCLSGLPVLMNDTIDQAVKNSMKIGNYYHISEINNIKKLSDDSRKKISTKASILYSRKEMNKLYAKFYTQFIKACAL